MFATGNSLFRVIFGDLSGIKILYLDIWEFLTFLEII